MRHPIACLGLQTRTFNAIVKDQHGPFASDVLREYRSGEDITPAELANVPDWVLLKLRNFGVTSLADVRNRLREADVIASTPVVVAAMDAFRIASFGIVTL